MPRPPNVFLLAGQSNMSGRGRLDDVDPLRHPQVFVCRGGEWHEAQEPLHDDKPDRVGVGLGMSFAVEVARDGRRAPVLLVPCAVGGTPLRRWAPGGDLYVEAVVKTRNALAGARPAGILWHQGESDSGTQADATTYARRLAETVEALRADLDAPDVPVVAGELGRFLSEHEGVEYFGTVNQQLHALQDRLPNFAVASAEGLGHNGDTIHFDAPSLRLFGERYARLYLEMIGPG